MSKPEKKRRSITTVTVGQTFFLTLKYFFKNRLLSYAGSCSFSFIFSFIPIFMMIFLILIKLNADVDSIKSVFSFDWIQNLFSPDDMIKSVQEIKKVDFFTIFLGLMILWMARRFLASILDGMQNIFHAQQGRKGSITFFMAFLVAIAIVLSISTIIFAFVSIKTMFDLNAFADHPTINSFLATIYSTKAIKIIPNLLLLFVLTMIYKIGPGTKPSLTLALCSSILCMISFLVFTSIVHYFLSTESYGRIYAGMGNLIILLMDVFFFFMFFMFFAQFMFTCQFFDELLMGELYLLPKREIKSLGSTIRRSLFIRPDYLLAKKYTVTYKEGEKIYKISEPSKFAYFISKGKIELHNKSKLDSDTVKFSRGDFFGEVGCIINKTRDSDAIAMTDVEVVMFEGEQFRFLVKHNTDAAHKALGQIGSYFTKYDGSTSRIFI